MYHIKQIYKSIYYDLFLIVKIVFIKNFVRFYEKICDIKLQINFLHHSERLFLLTYYCLSL